MTLHRWLTKLAWMTWEWRLRRADQSTEHRHEDASMSFRLLVLWFNNTNSKAPPIPRHLPMQVVGLESLCVAQRETYRHTAITGRKRVVPGPVRLIKLRSLRASNRAGASNEARRPIPMAALSEQPPKAARLAF